MTEIPMTYSPGSDGPHVYRCCDLVIFHEPQATYHLWRVHELPFLTASAAVEALSHGGNGLAQDVVPVPSDLLKETELSLPVLPQRCAVCDWPLAASPEEGCVPGNCSYRPEQGTPEHARIVALHLEAEKVLPHHGPTVLDAFLVQCEYSYKPCPYQDALHLLDTFCIPNDAPATEWGASINEAVQRWINREAQ